MTQIEMKKVAKESERKKNYGSEFQTGMDIFLCSKDNKFARSLLHVALSMFL